MIKNVKVYQYDWDNTIYWIARHGINLIAMEERLHLAKAKATRYVFKLTRPDHKQYKWVVSQAIQVIYPPKKTKVNKCKHCGQVIK